MILQNYGSTYLRRLCATVVMSAATAVTAAPREDVRLEALPDDPSVAAAVTDGTTEITQRREQNAITSVRIRRGNNTYYVTPSEQIPASQSGTRAAQWEIFQFRPGRSREVPFETPPTPPR
jgi:riboflavin biosynthesis pyrimidine reductase